MKYSISKYIVSYIFMTVIFTVMSVLACCIPHRLIDDNIRNSMIQLSEEGRFPWTFGNILWARDNVTDGTMYNIAVSGYKMNSISEALINPRTYNGDKKSHPADLGIIALNKGNDTVERISYGRYWHGYQVPLRITSIFLSIKGQRIFHSIVLWFIFIGLTWLIWKKFNLTVAAGWFISLLIIGFPAVPLSMQYVACYYIMFSTVLLILLKPSLQNNPIFFFITGGITAYMDFLTVPLITICIPLIFIVISNSDISNKKILHILSSWFIGYAAIWATKWILQSCYAGNDEALLDAVIASEAHTIIPFLPNGINHKFFIIACSLLGLFFITDLAIYLLKKNKSQQIKQIFFISLIPFVWYFFMLGHSVCHIWFTYRNLTATALCCWIIIFSNKLEICHGNSRTNTML